MNSLALSVILGGVTFFYNSDYQLSEHPPRGLRVPARAGPRLRRLRRGRGLPRGRDAAVSRRLRPLPAVALAAGGGKGGGHARGRLLRREPGRRRRPLAQVTDGRGGCQIRWDIFGPSLHAIKPEPGFEEVPSYQPSVFIFYQ